MATVFRRKRSKLWIASVRVWDAAADKWRWEQRPTGSENEATALSIAAALEKGSAECKAGLMTRNRAMALVNDILKMAGLDVLQPVPSLREFGQAFVDGLEVKNGTLRKYLPQWAGLLEWAGPRADNRIDTFTENDMQEYYRHVRQKKGVTTSKGYLYFASMIFGRAIAKGHCPINPTLTVKKDASDAVEKIPFTRAEAAKILRAIRKKKRKDWQALVSLGWHTGHRIQDLLDLTDQSVQGDLVTITPRKKSTKGGRIVILPLPLWLAKLLKRVKNFKTINHADNRNGKASEDFLAYLKLAKVDPMPVTRDGERTTHLKTFHSFRHAMSTRLISAGVSGEMARLVTDHDEPQVQRGYIHAEIEALREALKKARLNKPKSAKKAQPKVKSKT